MRRRDLLKLAPALLLPSAVLASPARRSGMTQRAAADVRQAWLDANLERSKAYVAGCDFNTEGESGVVVLRSTRIEDGSVVREGVHHVSAEDAAETDRVIQAMMRDPEMWAEWEAEVLRVVRSCKPAHA